MTGKTEKRGLQSPYSPPYKFLPFQSKGHSTHQQQLLLKLATVAVVGSTDMEPPVLDANINNNDIDGNLVDEDDGNVRMEEDEITLVAADAAEHARDDDDEEEEEDEDEDECRVCRGPAEEG